MYNVISYIDGFNFYYGLREKGWKKYYWVNPLNLCNSLLKKDQSLTHCHYFTARIKAQKGTQDMDRQSLWLDALNTLPMVTTHFGHYLAKKRKCKKCGSFWTVHEEKMTDVNIATQLLVDAYNDRFDIALLISGDSDLTTPIKVVMDNFPEKRVIVAFPPARHSDQLRKTATACFTIGQAKLRQNLLPDSIITKSGYELKRPKEWY